MTEENIIKLTNALYKVTGLFPKEEPLRFAIRKEGLDVLFFTTLIKGNSLAINPKEKEYYLDKAISKIDLVSTYFDIAKEQEWVNERNFTILEREYEELRRAFDFELSRVKKPVTIEKVVELKKEEPQVSEPEKKPEPVKMEIKHINYEELSNVQLKVLEILQGKGQLKSNQIGQFFPEMNPRTIRRELKGLKELKIISSNGGGKMTVYEINKTY